MRWFPFSRRSSDESTPSEQGVRAVLIPRDQPAPPKRRQTERSASDLSRADTEFLEGLVYPPELQALDDLAKIDQIFLGGLSKRVHARAFQVPLLPEVSIRLSELQRQVNVPVSSYVALISGDAGLSVEVLKAANAALYGATTTTNLSEAIMRIGLARLQAVLMLAHLKTRILSGSPLFRRSGELLLEISLPLGVLSGKLARGADDSADVRFMRGMLMHIEHMVMLGALGDVSREQRVAGAPSMPALLQAFVRFGPVIREAVASQWTLAEVLIGDDAAAVRAEYAGLRQAMICRWLRQPLPGLPGVEPGRLEEVMSEIQPRVAEPKEPVKATA